MLSNMPPIEPNLEMNCTVLKSIPENTTPGGAKSPGVTHGATGTNYKCYYERRKRRVMTDAGFINENVLFIMFGRNADVEKLDKIIINSENYIADDIEVHNDDNDNPHHIEVFAAKGL